MSLCIADCPSFCCALLRIEMRVTSCNSRFKYTYGLRKISVNTRHNWFSEYNSAHKFVSPESRIVRFAGLYSEQNTGRCSAGKACTMQSKCIHIERNIMQKIDWSLSLICFCHGEGNVTGDEVQATFDIIIPMGMEINVQARLQRGNGTPYGRTLNCKTAILPVIRLPSLSSRAGVCW